jgi:hypothetical protein
MSFLSDPQKEKASPTHQPFDYLIEMELTSNKLGNSYDIDVKDYNPRCCSCGNNGCANDCMDGYENEGQTYIVGEHDMQDVEDQDSDNEWDIDYPEEESSSEQEESETDLEEESSDSEEEESDNEDCPRDTMVLLNQLHQDVARTEDVLLDDEDGIFLSEETTASGGNSSQEVDLKVWN